ncbi:MAG: hypothetical protein HOA67_04985 [Candidatus Marinimicrobia bacterium]|jgi:hypothetical protein|nr:hypothetical protein [Candidatus Neomarinimicrobiota bacterium]|tara:strand:+ start:165 stop:389 length:225 start_codon:yes stop_codon:yes gene_type:complete
MTNLIDNEKIDVGFNELDIAMEKIINEHKLNFYEVLSVLAMMDTKVKQNNISQYLLETVTRFQELLNKEDEDGR